MHLKKGDIIDVIAPASSISKAEMAQIAKFLTKNGLKARFFNEKGLLLDKKAKNLFAAFSGKKRYEQLLQALDNKDSKAIWCARGGYGSAELIDFLQNHKKTAQTKLFIGFSDITSLAIFLSQKLNHQVIYGPMLTQLSFSKVSKKSEKAIFDFIFGVKKQLNYQVLALNNFANKSKKISGILTGGCLSVIAASNATPNQIDVKNKILFLEDIDETGEKIDRYFTQFLQIMQQEKSYPQAILLGNFYQDVDDKQKKANIKQAIANLVQKIDENGLKIAVFTEKTGCLGHSKDIMPVVIGGEVEIADGVLTI